MPGKSHGHRHKKDKLYSSNAGFDNNHHHHESAMMSGDSPNTHSHEHGFDFKDPGRSLPTTSAQQPFKQDRSVQSGGGAEGVVSAAAMVEPASVGAEGHAGGDIEASPECSRNDDEAIETDENALLANNRTANDHSKMNGTAIDDPDGKQPSGDTKKNTEEEEESCGIKCLYFTLQCCECTIL